MVTKRIDVQTTTQTLEDLIAMLNADTEVLLTQGDTVVARLAKAGDASIAPKPRVAGLHSGTTWVSDDFDDPLPDEFWLGQA